jgi:hypothetical protein
LSDSQACLLRKNPLSMDSAAVFLRVREVFNVRVLRLD